MNITALTYRQTQSLRAILDPLLEKPLVFSNFDLETTHRRIKTGQYLPVALFDMDMLVGVLICELAPDAVHVVLMGGENLPDDWKDEVVPMLKELAKDQDKQAVQLDGRPGWQRLLTRFGCKLDNYGERVFMTVSV